MRKEELTVVSHILKSPEIVKRTLASLLSCIRRDYTQSVHFGQKSEG